MGKNGAGGLERARYPTNCRGCGAPIAAGEPVLRRPRTAALTCAVCAQGELRPPPDRRQPREAA
jgi:hypothetical protein